MQPIRHRQLEPSVDCVAEADIEYRRSRIMSASIKSHKQQQHSMSRYRMGLRRGGYNNENIDRLPGRERAS